MEITSLSCPGQITPGRSFDLAIEHSADSAGQTVRLRALPADTFAVEPREAALGLGRSTVVACVVRRLRASSAPCTIGAALLESERFVTRGAS